MVDDNRQLATHIDSTIQSANQEVNSLRIELDATNLKLKELSMRDICRHCEGGLLMLKQVSWCQFVSY